MQTSEKGTRVSLAAKEFRIGRTYDEFQKYMALHPELSVVEMDTVEGGKDNSKQVFLTMMFRNCHLMLIFVLTEKSTGLRDRSIRYSLYTPWDRSLSGIVSSDPYG